MSDRTRRFCVAIGLVIALAAGVHHSMTAAHAAAVAAPGATATLFDDTSGHLTHTNTACAAASHPGQNYGNWVEVPCSSHPANCLSNSSSAATIDYDVDKMVDEGADPDNICLRIQRGDKVKWNSSKGRHLKISHLNAAGSNNNAHPFATDPPFGDGTKNYVLSPPVSDLGVPGKCYKFSAFIEVHAAGGVQCWDPHIYTDCTSCAAKKKGAEAKAPAKKK